MVVVKNACDADPLHYSPQVGEFNPAFDQFLKFINGIKYRSEF
jgi:hypothetical protein